MTTLNEIEIQRLMDDARQEVNVQYMDQLLKRTSDHWMKEVKRAYERGLEGAANFVEKWASTSWPTDTDGEAEAIVKGIRSLKQADTEERDEPRV